MDPTLESNSADDRRSGERVHPEPPDPLRTPFEVDRHRILSSAAFRRLEHKTQVFAPALGDHFRTRLTHTLEVAHLARCLARSLGVNPDLAEAIALAHDLGHPPFGHAGEVALNEAMRDHGGFNHNSHSLRVVEFLEHPFPSFRGLNLTRATLAGLSSHVTRYDTPAGVRESNNANVGSAVRTFLHPPPPLPRGDRGRFPADTNTQPFDPLLQEPRVRDCLHRLVRESLLAPSIEAQIASLADRLAYNLHDLEDAIGAELITLDDLAALEPWQAAYDRIANEFFDRSIFALRRPVLDAILDGLLADAIKNSPPSNEPTTEPSEQVSLSPSGETTLHSLEEFLLARVYRHPEIARTDAEGREMVRTLFARFLAEPSLLPPRFSSRIADQSPHRVICDYIAGMTDRFCKSEHARLVAS